MIYRYILGLMIIFGFILGRQIVYSCPESWQEQSFDATYSWVFDSATLQANFRIAFCYGWDTTEKEHKIRYKWIAPLQIANVFSYMQNWYEFLDWLHQETITYVLQNCITEHPYCWDTSNFEQRLAVETSLNVFYENWKPYWTSGYRMRIVFCNDGTIYKCLYRLCYDFQDFHHIERTIFLNMVPVNQRCAVGEPQVPPPGKTWEQHWITNCFERFHPVCPNFEN